MSNILYLQNPHIEPIGYRWHRCPNGCWDVKRQKGQILQI